nr:ribosomal protein S10 [Ulva meridionalis]UTA96708.1 ribosomal protein S10 [Ulva meridionalis]
MLIKKQHNKNIIFLEKLNKIKQQCCLKIQTLAFCCKLTTNCENSTVIAQRKKLTITLRSYAICQVKDISSSILAIEKLINYLNYLCAKQLHTNLKLYPIQPIFDKRGAIKESKLKPIILGFFTSSYTNLLKYQSTLLSRYQKQQELFKNDKRINCNNYSLKKVLPASIRPTDNFKQNSFQKEHSGPFFLKRLEKGQCFFKLSKKFSRLSAIHKKLVQRRNSKKLLTLIRAPFVFKKTREQFSLQRFSSSIVITFANSAQKDFIIQNLRLLKLPAELKVVSHN